jgi:hypothetical protein
MGNLSNLFISQSFISVLHTGNDNTLSAQFTDIQDGLGNSSGVSLNRSGSLSMSGSLTASLQQGYVWVGNSSGKTTTVPTSSFGGGGSATWPVSGTPAGIVSGSSQLTASYDLRYTLSGSVQPLPSGVVSGSSQLTSSYDLRYALSGSGGGTIPTGSFATTGSNQFTGNQTITGSSRQVGLSIEESGTSGAGNFSRFFIGTRDNGNGNLIISSSAIDRYIELAAGSGWMEVYANQTNFNNNVALRSRADIRNTFVNENYQIYYPTGSNQQAGTATLNGANPGTVTVSNSLVTANSIIMVSKQTLTHSNGYVAVSAKSAGSFTITSNHNGDSDVVGWFIINNS